MKKLIILLLLLISSTIYSQVNLQYINANDSLEIRQMSTFERIFLFSATKGIVFPDGTIQSTASFGGIPEAPEDSKIYGRINANWTEVKVDSAWEETITTYANIDVLILGNDTITHISGAADSILINSAGDTVVVSDGTLSGNGIDAEFDTVNTTVISGDNLFLDLATTQKAGAFDKGTTNPINTNRLNYDGDLYSRKILLRNGIGSSIPVLTFHDDDNTGISYSSADVFYMVASGSPVFGVGTKESGVFYSGIVDPTNSARLNYDGDLHTNNLTSASQTMGGTTVTGFTDSKTVIEGTPITNINFKDSTFASHSEGRVYYDSDEKTFNFQNDINGFTHNLGENNFRVYNNSGATIMDGVAVRRTGTYTNGSRVPTIDVAGIGSYDSSRVAGVTTVAILNNSYGVVTVLGNVNNIPTGGLSEDDFHLGHNGSFLDTFPPPPYWAVRLGWCSFSDPTNGAVSVNISAPTYAPTPIFTASFTRDDETIANGGLGVFSTITNATNDLYTEKLNYGFNFVGDSINALQDGIYSVDYNFAYHGDASQEDEWRVGVFVNGVEKFTVIRTSSTDQWGVVSGSFSGQLDIDDWVTFKVSNETNATRTSSFTDGAITLTYFKLF